MVSISKDIQSIIEDHFNRLGLVVFLTGAGISAESGVPTFRGAEGYWTVGSVNYHPQDMATHSSFSKMPDEVWAWYLYRRSICLEAQPNAAHSALVLAEQRLKDRFLLITQNVDGLHLRAGNSHQRTYQIHGNLNYRRCVSECGYGAIPLPDELDTPWSKERRLNKKEYNFLNCPFCGSLTRPHVLWFDEYYDENSYRFDSSIKATKQAALLVVVGTSGSTNLPRQICDLVMYQEIPMVVIDPDTNVVTQMADNYQHGVSVKGTAANILPELVDSILEITQNQSI